MTDKYTMEEKVKRLQELVPEVRGNADTWLRIAQAEISREEFINWAKEINQGIGEAVWDVHSGAAFTPLYRLL